MYIWKKKGRQEKVRGKEGGRKKKKASSMFPIVGFSIEHISAYHSLFLYVLGSLLTVMRTNSGILSCILNDFRIPPE